MKYLAARFDIPLDREHIIGHDDVPGPLDANYAGMHWDPGPWWDWGHYMALLGATAGARRSRRPVRPVSCSASACRSPRRTSRR